MLSTQPLVKSTSKILCCYINTTHKMQLVRVVESQNRSLTLEKIIFPHQRILLETVPEGRLEVYLERDGKQALAEIISCRELKVSGTI